MAGGWSRRDFLRSLGWTGLSAGLLSGGLDLVEACSSGGRAQVPLGGKPVRGGHLVEYSPADPTTLNGILSAGAGFQEIPIGNMFDSLLAFTPSGDLFPLLARALPTISADGTTYTFSLRPNVRWTDGQPLTADDVVFTYGLMFSPDYAAVRSPYRGDLQRVLASVTASDPMTVVMKTHGVYAPFLSNHGRHTILPKHVLGSLAPAAINSAPFNTAPTVSSGPFKFVEWVKGSHITLARNDDCYRGAPYLDTWLFRIVPDTNSALNQLKTGEIDVARLFSWGLLDDIQATSSLVADIFPGGPYGTRYIYQVDPSKPAARFFSDRAVRQALSYAVDRDGIASSVYFKKGATAAYSMISPVSWAYNQNVRPRYSYDARKAASMLDAAGWTVGTSGVREKGGVQLKFEVLASVESPEWTSTVQILQQGWKQIGVAATPSVIPVAQLQSRVTITHEFDVSMQNAQYGFPDPDPSPLFHSQNTAPGGQNASGYRNPALDQLLEAAAGTLDRARRKDLYFQIQDLLSNDVPSVPLNTWQALWVRNKRVQNLSGPAQIGPATASGRRPLINQVWVSDGK